MKVSELTNDGTNPVAKRGKLTLKLREILNLIEIYQKEGGVIHRDNAEKMDSLKDFIHNVVKEDKE
ncbi:MAG TPA: hypothetical protein PLM93_11185 [Sulfuricurvum sp.]|nr:MAG: hypothetical protein B7X89_12020 [Sulfuricurvum sp. 17-40-25]HQS67736.1 hypothetical protein [Sulfuricurvum sp.]HQT37671.1 hypothetical protein [Sulfuricurvum sp.]